jgi:hypothetical protein
MKQLDKLKLAVTSALLKAKKEKAKQAVVVTMTRDNFKKTLVTQGGFSSNDLKPVPAELYAWLQKKFGKNLSVKCTDMSNFTIDYIVKLA